MRTPRVAATLLVAASLAGCRHHAVPVAASTTPVPSTPAVTAAPPTPTPTPSHTHPASAPPSPARSTAVSASASPKPTCAARDVRVAIATDKPSYAQGETIRFTIRVTNAGRSRCQVDYGGLYVRITDPSGRPVQMPDPPGIGPYYPSGSPSPTATPSPTPSRSDDGASHSHFMEYAVWLDPGKHTDVPCDWSGRVRSSTGNSDPAGPGTYHASAEWQQPRASSPAVAFRIT